MVFYIWCYLKLNIDSQSFIFLIFVLLPEKIEVIITDIDQIEPK
jgi:hypothetical protein